MIPSYWKRVIGVMLVGLLTVALAACGSDDDKDGAPAAADRAEKVETSFLTGMLHHHESAVEMAKIAGTRGQDPFVKELAGNIVTTQEREMEEMKAIYKRLSDGTLKPDAKAHDGLGLSAQEAGMTHDADTNKMLETANPFDRAFVDEMEPHHQGAVKMSNVVLKTTKDPALRKLAQNIVRTQSTEIKEMNAFRTRKYGGPVPKESGSGMGEEHGGH